ncbi:hypothetical protein Btru_024026 [Bulinus truncatus]|nr:hypothetical protein Btru_024026 [Bulinus truncatus]
MKAAISKRKWTRLLTFYITFNVIFVIFVLLLYTNLKRRTLCFELPKEVSNNVSKTSLIIEKLWSIWSAFILFCTSAQSDNYKNEDEVKEQLENLCKNSYLSTETLKLILLTHLPQDIHIVLEAIHKYFTDSFANVISEKLLTVYTCLVGSLAILIANRIHCCHC